MASGCGRAFSVIVALLLGLQCPEVFGQTSALSRIFLLDTSGANPDPTVGIAYSRVFFLNTTNPDGGESVAFSRLFRLDTRPFDMGDSDNDGIPNFYEDHFFGTTNSPLNGNGVADFDGDGLTDFDEYRHYQLTQNFDIAANPTVAENFVEGLGDVNNGGLIGGYDFDLDGLPNDFETINRGVLGLDPVLRNGSLLPTGEYDVDGDLLGSRWEYRNYLNPLDDTGKDGAQGNPEQDPMTNDLEQLAGTNPREVDTPSGLTFGLSLPFLLDDESDLIEPAVELVGDYDGFVQTGSSVDFVVSDNSNNYDYVIDHLRAEPYFRPGAGSDGFEWERVGTVNGSGSLTINNFSSEQAGLYRIIGQRQDGESRYYSTLTVETLDKTIVSFQAAEADLYESQDVVIPLIRAGAFAPALVRVFSTEQTALGGVHFSGPNDEPAIDEEIDMAIGVDQVDIPLKLLATDQDRSFTLTVELVDPQDPDTLVSSPAVITVNILDRITYALNTTVQPNSYDEVPGSISRNPNFLSYLSGTQVGLTMNPYPGWAVQGWQVNGSPEAGAVNQLSLTMDQAKSVVATLAPINGPTDTDGDGVTDFDEVNNLATDPFNPDSDGDGVDDSEDFYPNDGSRFIPLYKVRFPVTSVVATESSAGGGNQVSLQAELTEVAVVAGSVNYTLVPGSPGLTAGDYQETAPLSGQLTWEKDDTVASATIDLSIITDGLVEGTETLEVSLSGPVNAFLDPAFRTVVIEIEDADLDLGRAILNSLPLGPDPLVDVTPNQSFAFCFAPDYAYRLEGLSLPIAMSQAQGSYSMTVKVFANDPNGAGEADDRPDLTGGLLGQFSLPDIQGTSALLYRVNLGTSLELNAGEKYWFLLEADWTAFDVSANLMGSAHPDFSGGPSNWGDCMVVYGFQDTAGSNLILADEFVAALIDGAGIAEINFAQAMYQMNEDGGQATLGVTITRPPQDAETVVVNVVEPAEGGRGTAYNYSTETLTWGPGDNTPRSVVVDAIDNGDFGGDAGYTFTLSDTSALVRYGALASTVLEILEDETALGDWLVTQLGGLPPSAQGLFDDPDFDGRLNIHEYGFGSSPTLADAPFLPVHDQDRDVLVYEIERRINDPSLTVDVEISDTLDEADFRSISLMPDSRFPGTQIASRIESETEFITVEVPLSANIRVFLRVRVEHPDIP